MYSSSFAADEHQEGRC